VTSSRDESYDRDNARFKRLEDEIHRLNSCVLQHVAAERKAAEDRLALAAALESLGSSDLTSKVIPHSVSTAAYLDSLTVLRRTTEHLVGVVEAPATNLLVARVIEPLGRMVKHLPVLRRLIDARRDACADYDAYVRRLKAEQGRGEAAEELRAEAKVAAAAVLLQEASTAVASALSAAEQARVILVRDAAEAILAVRLHVHTRSTEALQPLLVRMPGSATSSVDLAEGSIRALTATTACVRGSAGASVGTSWLTFWAIMLFFAHLIPSPNHAE
jgi:hypothetical protein